MKFQFAKGPSLALETVTLLHRHAQGMRYRDLKRRYLLRNSGCGQDITDEILSMFDALDDIRERVCSNIKPDDQVFDYYFNDCGMSYKGEDSIAVRSLATTMLIPLADPMICGYYEQGEHIKSVWKKLNEIGYEFSMLKMFLEINAKEDIVMGANYLLEQVDKLPFSTEFCYKLYKAFAFFDDTIDALLQYMEPYAVKLDAELKKLATKFDSAINHWRRVVKNEYSDSFVEYCINIMRSTDNHESDDITVCLNVSMTETNAANATWSDNFDAGRKTILLYFGADIRNGYKFNEDVPPVEYLYGMVKILADTNKMKMLNKMSKKEYYCSELAAELGLDVGNTSRCLRVLNELRLLTAEKIGNRTYYRTNVPTVDKLLQSLGNYLSDRQ